MACQVMNDPTLHPTQPDSYSIGAIRIMLPAKLSRIELASDPVYHYLRSRSPCTLILEGERSAL